MTKKNKSRRFLTVSKPSKMSILLLDKEESYEY